MYDHVLVPVDGSDASLGTIRAAGKIARRHDAILEVLYVVDTASIGPGSAALLDGLTRTAETAVTEARERATAAGVERVEHSISRGSPAREIVAAAEGADADLVVMGTHGRSGLQRVVLGSVTETVLRHASVPVLAIPTEEERLPA